MNIKIKRLGKKNLKKQKIMRATVFFTFIGLTWKKCQDLEKRSFNWEFERNFAKCGSVTGAENNDKNKMRKVK